MLLVQCDTAGNLDAGDQTTAQRDLFLHLKPEQVEQYVQRFHPAHDEKLNLAKLQSVEYLHAQAEMPIPAMRSLMTAMNEAAAHKGHTY